MGEKLRKYCLALDLKENEGLINKYKEQHENVWPEIIASIKDSGIEKMEIYNTGNRLFMIMTVKDSFSFELKSKMDASNPKVQEWEELMWKYQQAIPWAEEGEKWVLMEKIFDLN